MQLAQEQSEPLLQSLLESTAVHRALMRNGELVWEPGMGLFGDNLLALVGSSPEVRNPILQRKRQALEKLRFTELQGQLIDLLPNATRIDVLPHGELSRQLIELFQQQEDFEVIRELDRKTTRKLLVKASSAEIAILFKTKGPSRGNLAALQLRFYCHGIPRSWPLPPRLGSALTLAVEKLPDQ